MYFSAGLFGPAGKHDGPVDGRRPAADHHQHLAFGAELGDEVGPFVDSPDVVVLVDADRVRELEAVVALADLFDEVAVPIELEQPRRVAPVIDEGVPFESVATATDSPRYSPAGSLRKFGTVVKGISDTPVTWPSAGLRRRCQAP
jgi:hypothetical protein